MHSFNINRRNFLQQSAATLALTALGPMGLDIVFREKPYRVGLIGTGWYGKSDLFRLIQVAPVEVVSLCDVDRNLLTEAADLVSKRQKSGKKPKLYGDYRKMLAEDELDIVLIGTPDHWHALQGIEAMKSGANVYLQKPISVDVKEGEALVAAAKQYNSVVQVGLQRRSTPHLLDAKKQVIEAGLLGKVRHVEMCCYYHMRANRSPQVQPIPDFFDYDMWVGPAPMRPFDGLPHRGWWRAMMEYSNGIMGDMCVHMFDTARWLLDLGWPKRIDSTGGVYIQKESKATTADTQHAIFEYEELNCVWQHRSWGTAPDQDYPWALFLYGDKGTLKISTQKADFIPVDRKSKPIHFPVLYEREKYPEDLTEKDIELHCASATRGQMLDFLAAIENKDHIPVANIMESHISTASCILANISMKLGRAMVFDPVKGKVLGDRAANKLLARPYRKPWVHPG